MTGHENAETFVTNGGFGGEKIRTKKNKNNDLTQWRVTVILDP